MSKLELALLTVATLQAVVIGGLAAVLIHLHRRVIPELLNRLMSRSWTEYVAAAPAPQRPLRRRSPLTDEELARLEEQAKGLAKEARHG